MANITQLYFIVIPRYKGMGIYFIIKIWKMYSE